MIGATPMNDSTDAVTRPKHYCILGSVEAIHVIAASMTSEQWEGYCLGNILKYRLRAGKKADSAEQDLAKAAYYETLHLQWKHLCKPTCT